jgi:hypothetical protein
MRVNKPRWITVHAPHLSPNGLENHRPPPEPAPKAENKNVPWLWAQLHLRSLSLEGFDDSAWISEFGKRIPCGVCRQHWARMLQETPPNYFDYFAWSVDRHNEINAKLGKPIFTFEQALARWLQN